jgi:polyhydroxybutyrate depolymerase
MAHKKYCFIHLSIVGLLIGVILITCRFMPEQRSPANGSKSSSSSQAGDYQFTLFHNGIERSYFVHIPTDYDQTPTALVLNLHGGFGNGQQQCKKSKINAVSDANGFIVVCPTGSNKGGTSFYFWNDGYLVTNIAEDADDIAFIIAMIKDLKSMYNIDEARIFSTGMSNGAIMSYRFACELSDVVAAIAPVAGSMVGYFETSLPVFCDPQRPVPVIIIHGLLDENIPFEGGIGSDSVVKYDHPSVRQAVEYWIFQNGLSSQPTEEGRIGSAVYEKYGSDDNPGQVVLWALQDGGHSWPGGETVLLKRRLGYVNEDISASEEMWKFFEMHPKNVGE